MTRDPEFHFLDKAPVIREIFLNILDIFPEKETIRVSYVKNAILVAASSTFLAIKPKKDRVEVEFVLDREVCEFPIHKTFRVSKTKVAHFLKLDSPDEIDAQVTRWLKEAFELNRKKDN